MIKAALRLAVLALAGGTATAALLAHGGRWSLGLDVLTHFAPLWAVGAMAAVVVAALLRHRPALIVGAIGVVAAALLMIPEIGKARRDPHGAAAGPTLKLVQFNLWASNRDPQATLAWILAEDADIVFTEEATLNARGVREALQRAYPNWSSCDLPNPCSVMVYSRLPMTARGSGQGPPAAWATYHWRGRAVTAVGVHDYWPYPPGFQRWQLERLGRWARALPPTTTIIAGDFNSTPWSHTLQWLDGVMGLQRRTHGRPTWPAGTMTHHKIPVPAPFLAIDQVYAGSAWRTVDVRRGPKLGSDHYPVVVELTP